MHYHLARTKVGGVIRPDIQLVTSGGKLLPDNCRDTLLDAHLASSGNRKAWSIEGGLDIHLEVDEVCDEFGLSLRLIRTANNTKADVQVALFEVSRNQ